MAENRVIFLVLTVIVVGTLAVLSFQLIQKSNLGIKELWKQGETFKKKTSPIDLYSSCSDWLAAGSEAYNSRSILETYKLHLYMKPYKNLWRACGELMESLAKKCLGGGTSKYCNGEYIIADNLDPCIVTCENIKVIYDACKNTCPDRLPSCFNYLINSFSSSDFRRGRLYVPERLIDKACGE